MSTSNRIFLSKLTMISGVAVLLSAFASIAAEPPVAQPLRDHELEVTLYIKETEIPDGRGMTVLMEIVNTSGRKIRVTDPPIVRRLGPGETLGDRPRGRTGRDAFQGPAPQGPLAPDKRLPPPTSKPQEQPKNAAEADVEQAFLVVTCTIGDRTRTHPILRSGLFAVHSKTLSPGDTHYLHVEIRGDELAPGPCRLEAFLIGKDKTLGTSNALTVRCVAPAAPKPDKAAGN
jgi:hypothetical protein